MTTRDEIATEVDRIVHRLTTMPLNRLTVNVCDDVRAACQRIVDLTPSSRGHALPVPDSTWAGAMVAVVVRDLLDDPASDLETAHDVLVELRRELP